MSAVLQDKVPSASTKMVVGLVEVANNDQAYRALMESRPQLPAAL